MKELEEDKREETRQKSAGCSEWKSAEVTLARSLEKKGLSVKQKLPGKKYRAKGQKFEESKVVLVRPTQVQHCHSIEYTEGTEKFHLQGYRRLHAIAAWQSTGVCR